MATFTPCAPHPVCRPAPAPHLGPASLLASARAVFDTQVVRRLDDWRAKRLLAEEMMRLDHRELKDLGLVEADIPSFVAAWTPKH